MLSREENELLCRIGPGTPMGQMMRRYWMPALLSEELPEPDGAPIRVPTSMTRIPCSGAVIRAADSFVQPRLRAADSLVRPRLRAAGRERAPR